MQRPERQLYVGELSFGCALVAEPKVSLRAHTVRSPFGDHRLHSLQSRHCWAGRSFPPPTSSMARELLLIVFSRCEVIECGKQRRVTEAIAGRHRRAWHGVLSIQQQRRHFSSE